MHIDKVRVTSPDIFQFIKLESENNDKPEQLKRSTSAPKRPKTPHELFKEAIRETPIPIPTQHKRKEKIKTLYSTSNPKRVFPYFENFRQEPNERRGKIVTEQAQRDHPTALNPTQLHHKIRDSKIEIKEEIGSLKNEISSVLSEIELARQLKRTRMDKKYSNYNFAKFGKFWNSNVMSLSKTNFVIEKEERLSKAGNEKVSKSYVRYLKSAH